MLPTNISSKFEVGDLIKCKIIEEADDPPMYFLLLEDLREENPFSNRWRALDPATGDIRITYVGVDMWEKVT
jgi:hypothetical protein